MHTGHVIDGFLYAAVAKLYQLLKVVCRVAVLEMVGELPETGSKPQQDCRCTCQYETRVKAIPPFPPPCRVMVLEMIGNLPRPAAAATRLSMHLSN